MREATEKNSSTSAALLVLLTHLLKGDGEETHCSSEGNISAHVNGQNVGSYLVLFHFSWLFQVNIIVDKMEIAE